MVYAHCTGAEPFSHREPRHDGGRSLRRVTLMLVTTILIAAASGMVTSAQAQASKGNVLVIERADYYHEAQMAAAFLRSLNYTVALAEDVPAKLSPYSSVWYVSFDAPISMSEQAAFEQYVNQGGSLYLSGGSCCEGLNESDTAIARAVLNNKEIFVGRQAPYNSANPNGNLYFNPQAADGVTSTPNKLDGYGATMPGGRSAIEGIGARNVLAGDDATAAAAVFDERDMELGRGRLAIYENNHTWLGILATNVQRMTVIQNIADFLEKTPTRLAPRSAEYVALGDSYAAGVGAFSYLPGTTEKNGCYRATDGYAEKIAAKENMSLEFPACLGAKIPDLMEGKQAQLRTLGVDTKLVTLSIGGNDVGFAPVLQSCISGTVALGGEGCATRDASAAATALEWLENGRSPGTYRLPGTAPPSLKLWLFHKWVGIKNKVTNKEPQPSLQELYEDIAMQAPYAQIFVVGYPRLFDRPEGPSCPVGSMAYSKDKLHIATSDTEWIDEQASKVDQLIEQVVANLRNAGIQIKFVDPQAAFAGHALCHPELPEPEMSYLYSTLSEGLSTSPATESFHPTKEGQEALDALIEAARNPQ